MRFKKKKVTKKRASTYHGYGRGQSHHKGAGNRGGRGRAGTGKRADTKKPSYWKKEKTGRTGFASKSRIAIRAINLEHIASSLEQWLKQGLATKSPKGFEIDLKKTRYNKLLGKGTAKEKLFIITDFASHNAVEKVKAAGGEVKVLKTSTKKEKKAGKPKKKEEAIDSAEEGEGNDE